MLARIMKEQAGDVCVFNAKKKKSHAEPVALISLLSTAARICLWKLLPQLWGLVKHWAACTGRPLVSLSKAPKRESNFFSRLRWSGEFFFPSSISFPENITSVLSLNILYYIPRPRLLKGDVQVSTFFPSSLGALSGRGESFSHILFNLSPSIPTHLK